MDAGYEDWRDKGTFDLNESKHRVLNQLKLKHICVLISKKEKTCRQIQNSNSFDAAMMERPVEYDFIVFGVRFLKDWRLRLAAVLIFISERFISFHCGSFYKDLR